MERVELTPQQQKQWDETRVALLWDCPAFAHILFTLMNNSKSKHLAIFTRAVPIAATDGSNLMLNPDTFFKYNLKERVFIVGHEICHCIFNHMGVMLYFQKRGEIHNTAGKKLPYSHPIMNIAADLVINDMLINSRNNAGSPVFQYNKDWLHNREIATEQDSIIDAYFKVWKKAKKGGGQGQQPGNGQGQDHGIPGQRFDEHLKPGTSQGKDPTQADQERNEVQWKTEVAAAMHAAKLQGKLPANLERFLNSLLDPVVDWNEKIKGLFARKVGNAMYDWRRVDRRLIVRDIVAPGRASYGANDVVVACDTSGSIDDPALNRFFAEMGGIIEDVRPRRIFLLWCDAKVHRVDELEQGADLIDVKRKGAPGGGGTDFRPVFEWMRENDVECDALVFLTDGYGAFPDQAPTYPVIWGNISPPGAVKYPFGDVVDVPAEAA